VSTRHAKISRTATGYRLCNWQGQFGIGLYERELGPQEEHALKHCDVFHIPAREEHVRFQFLESEDKTQVIPLEVEHQRQKVYVFSERVHLTANQYRLLAHLHRHKSQVCSYDALMAAVWNDANLVGRKGNLEVLLHDVRAKLRAASGGFTFMETVRGQGVRLVV
jgi:DNA-binding response OmpR family regulator